MPSGFSFFCLRGDVDVYIIHTDAKGEGITEETAVLPGRTWFYVPQPSVKSNQEL